MAHNFESAVVKCCVTLIHGKVHKKYTRIAYVGLLYRDHTNSILTQGCCAAAKKKNKKTPVYFAVVLFSGLNKAF